MEVSEMILWRVGAACAILLNHFHRSIRLSLCVTPFGTSHGDYSLFFDCRRYDVPWRPSSVCYKCMGWEKFSIFDRNCSADHVRVSETGEYWTLSKETSMNGPCLTHDGHLHKIIEGKMRGKSARWRRRIRIIIYMICQMMTSILH